MAAGGNSVNVNINLRTDARPEQLLKELVLSPLIYIRLVGILFSIIVFGCVADKVAAGTGSNGCYYNGSSACSFAIAVGVIAFLLCIVFLVKDVLYVVIDYSDNVVIKKVIILVDAVTNGFWAFMWFVCFCYTADQLRRFNSNPIITFPDTATRNCANSAVAFSFFSIFAWVAIVVVNVIFFLRIWRGTDVSTRPGPSGYASFPEGSEDQPEDDEGEHKPQQQYQPPEY